MNKKQVTAGLIIAGVMASNISSVKAILGDEDILNILDEKDKDNLDNDNNCNKDNENKHEESNKNINQENNENPNQEDNENLNQEESDIENNPSNDENNIEGFIEIKDENLLKAINSSLNRDDLTSQISKKDVVNTTSLNLNNCNITELSGLEYFENLEFLDISNNNIVNISNLSNLSNLKEIKALNNNISDISCLKKLNLIKADFSNQIINLEDMIIASNILNIKNPIKVFEGLNIDYIISNNGIHLDGIFTWDNLLLENYNLEVLFNGTNENIKFSGTILQSISKDNSIVNDIEIEMLPDNLEWVNSDLTVKYNINGTLTPLIDKVELPNGKTTSNLIGSFSVSDNGTYILKVFFTNGEFIEKSLEIKNIDKDKPTFNLLSKTVKNNITSIELEAIDALSGIDYILLPNNKKVYDTKITYSSKLNDTICFKAVDLAGNHEEFKVYSENIKDKLPTINASNKTLTLGSKFNPLKGVSATDYKGNDITDNIKVLSNTVDIHSLGEYVVTYSVQDFNGYETTKSIIVEVVDKEYSKNDIISSDNKDILESLESNISDKDNNLNNSLSVVSKSTYSTAIILSMISGFIFFFKSGKDNF